MDTKMAFVKKSSLQVNDVIGCYELTPTTWQLVLISFGTWKTKRGAEKPK